MTLIAKRREYATKLKAYQRKYSSLIRLNYHIKIPDYVADLAEIIRTCKTYIRRIDVIKKQYKEESTIPKENIDDLTEMHKLYQKMITEFDLSSKKLGL